MISSAGFKMFCRVLGVATGMMLFLASPAHAQNAEPGVSGHSAQEIIDALKPDAVMPARRMRGLSLDVPGKAQKKPETDAQTKFVDLNVPFEFNSDELTAEGRDILAKLSEALASKELSGISSVTLEGHTDGVGSAAYNRALSLRRAQTVRQFLQGSPDLQGKLFRVVGKGATDLLNPENPADGVNRRVRVVVHYAGAAAVEKQ